jgi:hypothetical protein
LVTEAFSNGCGRDISSGPGHFDCVWRVKY